METWDGVGTHAFFPAETLRDQTWVLRGRDSQRRAVGRWPVRDTETPLHTDSWEVCGHTGTAVRGSRWMQEAEVSWRPTGRLPGRAKETQAREIGKQECGETQTWGQLSPHEERT